MAGALIGAGVSITAETAWELAEYGAMRLGAHGMDLTYDDTMAGPRRRIPGRSYRRAVHADPRAACPDRTPTARLARTAWDSAANVRREAALGSALRLTYIGHATVLIEVDGVRILTDPVLGHG
jgi:hypothetical protein